MPFVDLTSLLDYIVSGVVGLLFGGIIGGFITYRFDRKRDDLRWERDKQQLEKQWKHEKELRLKELETQYKEEKANNLRKQLLIGVERPMESIAEAQRLSSLRLPIKRETRGGWPNVFDTSQKNLGYVEIFQVGINDRIYYVAGLGLPIEQQIIDESHNYAIVKVVGNSMNRAGINNGDYTLIRLQNNANNGDIVIAEILGVDTSATIKRLVMHDDKIILKPESTNADFVEYEHRVSTLDEGFRILGIAIVAFKPQEF